MAARLPVHVIRWEGRGERSNETFLFKSSFLTGLLYTLTFLFLPPLRTHLPKKETPKNTLPAWIHSSVWWFSTEVWAWCSSVAQHMKLNKHTYLLQSQRRFYVCIHLNDSCLSKRKALFLALEVVCDLFWGLLSCSWVWLGELPHLRYFVLPCPKLQQLS